MVVIIIKLKIESQLIYLPFIRNAVRGICSSIISDEEIFQHIDLSLIEALSNIIHHAYGDEANHEIELTVTLYPEEVAFEIIDRGLKNPHIQKPSTLDFDLTNIDSLKESGRGLFIIHKLMDEVIYFHEEGKNILFLRKRIK